MTNTRFYKIWVGVKKRGTGKHKRKNYVDKGIFICDKWLNFIEFKNDMLDSYNAHCSLYGVKETTIDRIDNRKGYNKENCRWATYKEQARNTGKNSLLTFNGETLCVSEWAEKIGVNKNRFNMRIYNGWTVKDAITLPKQERYYKARKIKKMALVDTQHSSVQ